jgi:aminoglycoside 6'-N-acetyltransferase I
MIVERCTSQCFEKWIRLRQALWPDEVLEEHLRYAASIVNRPNDAMVYIAREDNGCVVAFAEATLRRDYVNGCNTSPVGFLEGLYVDVPYRGRGLARLLCSALEKWAASLGCREFASDVLLHNETGLRVHEALGFEESERVVFYVKRLKEGDGETPGTASDK